LSDFI